MGWSLPSPQQDHSNSKPFSNELLTLERLLCHSQSEAFTYNIYSSGLQTPVSQAAGGKIET